MKHDVLIAGGGLAGSAAAILLARAGRSVVLLERDAEARDKVCGEFLSKEALGYLAALGADVAALGAVPIGAVRLAGASAVTRHPLPFAARSLTRRVLDEHLLHLAATSGATVLRGHSVQTLRRSNEATWQAQLSDGSTVEAGAAFVATGKHDLPGQPRPAGPQPGLIAFKMYFRLAPQQAEALAGHVELLLYPGGYAGLQPVEDHAANLCCLVDSRHFQRVGSRWDSFLAAVQATCPHLRERLHGAQPLLSRPLAIAHLPYGYVRPQTVGSWYLGDQAAVIPSFTGDGMSLALHSGWLAADMFLQGEPAAAFQQRLHAQLAPQVAFAARLSRAMVRQPQQRLIQAAVRLWPGALGMVARRTRLRSANLLFPTRQRQKFLAIATASRPE